MTPANRDVLERFAAAREMGLMPRLLNFWRCGIYRQIVFGHLGLIVAAFFKKI